MKWKIQETKLHAIPAGSFAVHTEDICSSRSFAVQFRDHFRSGDHLRSGIICGAVRYYNDVTIITWPVIVSFRNPSGECGRKTFDMFKSETSVIKLLWTALCGRGIRFHAEYIPEQFLKLQLSLLIQEEINLGSTFNSTQKAWKFTLLCGTQYFVIHRVLVCFF